MRLPRPLHALLLAAALPGCGTTHEFDEGTICLADQPALMSFQDGGDVELKVILDPCMGCVETFDAACSTSRDGDTITIDAHGGWSEKGAVGGCAAVCIELAATCVIRDLPVGTYKLVSGSNQLTVTLPLAAEIEQDAHCAGG